MTELIIEGQRVRVSDDFLSLSPEEQERTVDEIAASLPAGRREPALSQLNIGIADTLGGLVDLINPFDTPAVSEALGLGDAFSTGSARAAMVSGMQATGMVGADRAPDGLGEALLRGGGQAAGGLPIAATGAQALSAAPGLTGRVSGEVARGLSTRGAVAAEIAAGGASGAGMEAAEDAGLPDWAVGLAGVVAPMALAGGVYAASRAPQYLPGVTLARRGVEAATATLAPYTRRGAEEVARRSVQDLAGGRDRAIAYGERINPNDEFNLTPAQQIGEPEFLALEQMAAQDPNTRSILERRFAESMGLARSGAEDVGGDVSDAQRFFREERAHTTAEMRAVAQQALRNAEARLQAISPERRPSENSAIVMEEIERALETALERERELWLAVPMVRQVGTENARRVAARIVAETGDELQGDIPASVMRRLIDEETGYHQGTNMRNLHALYSRLRQVAREASAGQAPNDNRARIANEVADAILEDMAAAGITEIDAARAFSRSLHETFDRGAYGRLSRQTIQGDTVTDPRVALDRSVARGGTAGMVDAENLETAAAGVGEGFIDPLPNDRARGAIVDYVRGRFADVAITPDASGQEVLNPRGASQFIRNNRELLERYPELRGEILDAGRQQQTADQLADTIALRIEAVENARTNPTSGFADASQEQAVRAIIDAENPIQAAQAVRASARRDETGAALAGVKAAFSDELIRRALRTRDGAEVLDADAMLAQMRDPRFRAAMNRILEPAEIRRLERVVEVVQRLNQARTPQPSLGRNSLSGARAPRVIEALVRIVAVNQAPTGGQSAGASLQTANIVSSNARDFLGRITADRASRIIAEAITDPRLFQALLMDPASARFEAEGIPRLVPYLVGAGAVTVK